MLAGATTIDDRGRRVAVIDPSSLALGSADIEHAPVMARYLREVARAESQRITLGRVAIGVVLGLVLLALSSLVHRVIPGAPPLTGVAVFWGGVVVMPLVARIIARRTHGHLLSATAASAGPVRIVRVLARQALGRDRWVPGVPGVRVGVAGVPRDPPALGGHGRPVCAA